MPTDGDGPTVGRRQLLAAAAAAAATGSAGCSVSIGDSEFSVDLGDDDTPTADGASDGDESDADPGTDTETETETEADVPRGGTPIVGLDDPPDTLNILKATSESTFRVLDQLYSRGTTLDPADQQFEPWAFEDWTLEPANVGGSRPTITATLRDDLTFNDGEPVTAEDVQFTVQYLEEQEPGASIHAGLVSAVDSVGVDSPDGTTVHYYLDEADARWFTSILGLPILPMHIWRHVADHTTYEPSNEPEGVVGSGPMTLEDFSWENWYELSMRPREEIPWNSAEGIDWLHDDGPFVDGVRVEVFGSRSALEQAVLNGDVAVAAGSWDPDDAIGAGESDSLDVATSEEDGWNHHSYNLRRVPLDDVAFRQLLVKLTDKQWYVDEVREGIGARAGSYATTWSFEDWRPPEPDEIDVYEGIPVPDLAFPGVPGTFQLTEGAVQAARDFLINHPEAKHDYAFGAARSSATNAPDGQELYVNGRPFGQAHTDNDGNGGQGPLELSFNSPQEDAPEARFAQRTLGALKRVGVPATSRVESLENQLSKVYASEDFDVYAMGWSGGINHRYFGTLFGSEGADLDGTSSFQQFNPMGYTGADDLVDRLSGTMDPAERKRLVKQILAQIYHDAPTNVVSNPRILQPVSTRFTGWVTDVGGVAGTSTWLNLRRSEE